jgi:hypothetical protein
MKSATIDIQSLERMLDSDVAGSAGGSDTMMDREHPLAGELRKVLQNRDAKTVGDLAKVVEHLMREMAFLKG